MATRSRSNSYCLMPSPWCTVCACVVLSFFAWVPFACGATSDGSRCPDEEGVKSLVFSYCTALGIDKERDYVGTERAAKQLGAPIAPLVWKVSFTRGRFVEVDARSGDIQRVLLDPEMIDMMRERSSDRLEPMPQLLPANLAAASNLVGSDLPFGEALRIGESCCTLLGESLAGHLKCVFKGYIWQRMAVLSQRESEAWVFVFDEKDNPDGLSPIVIGVRSGDVFLASSLKRLRGCTDRPEAVTEGKAYDTAKAIVTSLCRTATLDRLRPASADHERCAHGGWTFQWNADIVYGERVLPRGISCTLTKAGELISYSDLAGDWRIKGPNPQSSP